MNWNRALKIGAVVCFVLAIFGVPLAAISMISIGLVLSTCGDIL